MQLIYSNSTTFRISYILFNYINLRARCTDVYNEVFAQFTFCLVTAGSNTDGLNCNKDVSVPLRVPVKEAANQHTQLLTIPWHACVECSNH